MDESVGDKLTNDDFGNESDFFPQSIFNDLVLRKLLPDESDETLESDGITLGANLVQTGLEL